MKVITKRTGIKQMQSKSSDLMPFFIINFPTKTKISQRRDINF